MRKTILLIASLLLPLHAGAAADRQLDAGIVQYKQLASSPATPSAGYTSCYTKTDGKRYCRSSAGTEYLLPYSGDIVNADINASAAIAYSKLNLAGSIVNADINASAAIADTKLAQITTASKVANSATTATPNATNSAIVARDGSGGFVANKITHEQELLVKGISTPTTPSAGYVAVYAKSDDKVYKKTSAGVESEIGSGGGGGSGINLLTFDTSANLWSPTKVDNFNQDTLVGDWAAYADAAGTQPVDMTGGSPGTTCARTTSSPLNGAGSLLMDLGSGSSRQGEGCSVLVNVPPAYRGKNVGFVFPFETSGTILDGEVVLASYDVTNGSLLSVFNKGKILGANGQAIGVIPIPYTAAQIRVGLHVARTATGALTVKGDDFQVSPQIPATGPRGAEHLGKLVWATTANCTWVNSASSNSFTDVGTDSDCPDPTVTGNDLLAPSTKTVGVRIQNTSKDYEYFIDGKASFAATSNGVNNLFARWSDGTNNSSANMFNGAASSYGTLTGQVPGAGGLMAIKMQCTGDSVSESCDVRNNTGVRSTEINVWRIPKKDLQPTTASESSTIWISSFLATGTRVTATPTKLGEYRTLIKNNAAATFADTDGSGKVSAANGMRIYATGGTGAGNSTEPNKWVIFVGRNKGSVKAQFFSSTGRTGGIFTDYDWESSSREMGLVQSYDPTTGLLVINPPIIDSSVGNRYVGVTQDSGTGAGSYANDAYFDVQVSENALAVTSDVPTAPVYAVVSGNGGGQSSGVALKFPNENSDPSNIYSAATGQFTVPARMNVCNLRWYKTGDGTSRVISVYKNNTVYLAGSDNSAIGSGVQTGSMVIPVVAGDTLDLRASNSTTDNAADNAGIICWQ